MRGLRTKRVLLAVVLFSLSAPAVAHLGAQQSPAPIVRPRPPYKGKAALAPPKAEALTPLTERERAEQMLDRFTFGARPGDVDHVLAIGVDKWFEQQLSPQAIPDGDLQKRLNDYPTLNMTPRQALTAFPDRGTIQRVSDGKQVAPTDPLLASVYEVQVAKLRREQAERKPDAGGNLPPEPSDADKAAEKQEGQITAARLAGESAGDAEGAADGGHPGNACR